MIDLFIKMSRKIIVPILLIILMMACEPTRDQMPILQPVAPKDSTPSKELTDGDADPAVVALPPASEGVSDNPPPVDPLNIIPESAEVSQEPLIISNRIGDIQTREFQAGDPIYISWSIVNNNPDTSGLGFFVDLTLDGIPVERWLVDELAPGEYRRVPDWDGLLERTSIEPGPHILTLIVDPTGILGEGVSGTKFTASFVWPIPLVAEPLGVPASSRLPNLVLFTPEDWMAPIRLDSLKVVNNDGYFEDELGIQIAFRNNGLSSVGGYFQVHLYLNQTLIARFGQRELISNAGVVTARWNEILEITTVSPGSHSLVVMLDPTNLIEETEELDNVFAIDFTWDGNSNPTLTEPKPSSNAKFSRVLSGNHPLGWGAPLVLTHSKNPNDQQSQFFTNQPVYANWSIVNSSDIGIAIPFSIELLVDGVEVQTWQREGIRIGETIFVIASEIKNYSFSPGEARIELLATYIDPATFINTQQTLFNSNVFFVKGTKNPYELLPFNDLELMNNLLSLEALRSTTSILNEPGSLGLFENLKDLAGAVYFKLYRTRLENEALSIHFLNDSEFSGWISSECADVITTYGPTPGYLERCQKAKEYSGYYSEWRGLDRILVRSDRRPMHVLNILAHELGHFRQKQFSRAVNFDPSINVLALREAQAYAHQGLFFRVLESSLGEDLLLYPALEGFEQLIDARLELFDSLKTTDEHARGTLLLWLSILTDPNLRQERTAMLNNRVLGVEEATSLFTYMLRLSEFDLEIYVPNIFNNLSSQYAAIQSLAKARLISGLAHWNEGSPDLQELALLYP